jgi:hypothetical protein
MSSRFISWGKVSRCVRLITLPPPCAVVMKCGNLNFLEPSGPLQACNGTALPFTFTLRHEHGQKISENRIAGKTPGLKRDEVTGDGRRLNNEDLHDSYCSPNIIRVINV